MIIKPGDIVKYTFFDKKITISLVLEIIDTTHYSAKCLHSSITHVLPKMIYTWFDYPQQQKIIGKGKIGLILYGK